MRDADPMRALAEEIEELESTDRLLAELIVAKAAVLSAQLDAVLGGLATIVALLTPTTHPAVGLRVSIGGQIMDVTLSVDVTGEVVSAQFVDDKGDLGATPPTGADGNPATIAYSSSDPSVAEVDPATGSLKFNKAGTATLTATASSSDGSPVSGFPTGTANLTLTPGAAAGLEVSVDGAPPVPAPGT